MTPVIVPQSQEEQAELAGIFARDYELAPESAQKHFDSLLRELRKSCSAHRWAPEMTAKMREQSVIDLYLKARKVAYLCKELLYGPAGPALP